MSFGRRFLEIAGLGQPMSDTINFNTYFGDQPVPWARIVINSHCLINMHIHISTNVACSVVSLKTLAFSYNSLACVCLQS